MSNVKINKNGNVEMSLETYEALIQKTYKEGVDDCCMTNQITHYDSDTECLWFSSIAKNQTLCLDHGFHEKSE